MQSRNTQAEVIAEEYYDSSDADRFYELVWGGEDIHIGLYEPGDSISEASHKTVVAMATKLKALAPGKEVIDLGAGYGGAGRYLAREFKAKVTCLNLSEVQNERDRLLNKEQGLEDLVTVLHGSYESIPAADNSMDIVWSQDAFLHSANKEKIIEEIDRVLRPGGEVIFTDPMQADDCPAGVLQAVYDRLHLDSLASFAFYKEHFKQLGFSEVAMEDLTHQLRNHYSTVRENLLNRYDELTTQISTDYMDRMILGLENWVKAADQGYLAWGILHFRKQG